MRLAAPTETWEYPRKVSGLRGAPAAGSWSTAFQAASSMPRASQLSVASRCEAQKSPAIELYREPMIMMVSASLLREPVSDAKHWDFGMKNRQTAEQLWRIMATRLKGS